MGKGTKELTKTEQEVLTLLTEDFLTPKQIALRRQTSKQATYKTIKKLKDLGLVSKDYRKVDFSLCGSQPKHKIIRLHGQEFNIKILYQDHRYKQILKTSNTIINDGCTIRLYRNSVEIYANKSFWGETSQKATSESMKYWQRFFIKLENDLKVILIKHRANNIKIVKAHYANINNPIATQPDADNIKIYAKEDGKLWFQIDNSLNLHEGETQHPETAKEDMQDVIRPFLNDLRDHKVTMGDLIKLIHTTIDMQQVNTMQIKALLDLLTPAKPINEEISQEKPYYVG